MNPTGNVTDPNGLRSGQFAVINEHMWVRSYDGMLYDTGSVEGANSRYMAGVG